MEQSYLESWKKSLKSQEKALFEVYNQEASHFNKTVSLYSRKKDPHFCWELILDSYIGGGFLLKDASFHLEIADLGSGAGFPGLILACLDPLKKIILVDSNPKKTQFLKYIVWKMQLKNVEIRTVDLKKERNSFICAVSKAFLPLDKRLEITRPCFKKGAIYYHFQTLGWENQWNKARLEIKEAWELKELAQYDHPLFSSKRVLLKARLK